MKKKIIIIGSGIVGLVTATMIKNLLPDASIEIYDAGSHPGFSDSLIGVTFGQGRDARQFTGSESLSYQNPVHSRALRLAPGEHKVWAGWRLIAEDNLTENERRWRSHSTHLFTDLGHENLNQYDYLHAQFNYAGMAAWDILGQRLPEIAKYRISSGSISVFFTTRKNFEDDLESETIFLQQFGEVGEKVKIQSITKYNSHFKKLVQEKFVYKKALQLPGSSWRIRSLGLKLLADLEKQGVLFHWHKQIINHQNLNGDVIIWTAGTTHAQPVIYRKCSLIQGLAGCWVTIPNRGLTQSLKISLPQPSGYINCTPDHDVIHISGGFGWVGERSYYEAVKMMDPIVQHFKKQVARYFELKIDEMEFYPIGICIRPSSPTGLPDLRTINVNNQKNIILTGSGKSGSTQAPLLALYALSQIDIKAISPFLHNSHIKKTVRNFDSLQKIHVFGESLDYPIELENDLFGVKK